MVAFANPPIAANLAGEPTVDPKLKGIGGWLLLFCLALTVFGPALGQRLVFASHRFDTHSLAQLAIILYGLIVGVFVWSVHRFAFTLLWIYFGIRALFSLLWILSYTTGAERYRPEQLGVPMRTLTFVAIWYLYFHTSKRVRATFGHNM